ncbi:hypothetical protein BH20ACI3_BH20ACI3_05080 [soil metagenome]
MRPTPGDWRAWGANGGRFRVNPQGRGVLVGLTTEFSCEGLRSQAKNVPPSDHVATNLAGPHAKVSIY